MSSSIHCMCFAEFFMCTRSFKNILIGFAPILMDWLIVVVCDNISLHLLPMQSYKKYFYQHNWSSN